MNSRMGDLTQLNEIYNIIYRLNCTAEKENFEKVLKSRLDYKLGQNINNHDWYNVSIFYGLQGNA